MLQGEKKQKFDPNTLRRKTFIVEKFINFLIIVRMYATQVPLWIWTIILLLLYALKLRRQGNIPSSIFVLLGIICSISGQYFKIDFIFLMAPILAGISHFFSYKTYWFPRLTKLVGMRQEVLQNDTYILELYPVVKNEKTTKKVIYWNHTIEMNRIAQHQEDKGKIYVAIMRFFSTALTKVKLIFAEGDQEPTDHAIVFSHGRSATPYMYSQILSRVVSFETQKFGVFAVQHNEKSHTGLTEEHKIKRFREIQVQVRATQMYSAVQHCKNKKKIVMMGHSYGCATTIQTYHCLPPELKDKVSHLVLLDPWLFPLTQGRLIHEINCPVLILANEYFLENEDVYNRNKEFLKHHKKDRVIYLAWKQGDHLHQIDLCFLFGNIMNRIKHPQLSLEMLNKNLKAIEMFLTEKNLTQQKMRQTFKDEILPEDYKPAKWNNYLTL